MDHDDEDGWWFECGEVVGGLTAHVFELAGCVVLPIELCAHAEAADLDADYINTVDEWLTYLSERKLLLPVEQSCNAQGLLLPWDMRAVRLRSLPDPLLCQLHFFFDKCPRHSKALLVHYVFWLGRVNTI